MLEQLELDAGDLGSVTVKMLTLIASAAMAAPNFLLVMCDDMDIVLGGVNATPQVAQLLGAGGAAASNYFVSSPKCTPSRSAWLSGRHYHNLRPHGATTGKGLNTTNFFGKDALFPTLRANGYRTALFGKLHNDQHSWLCTPGNHSEPFDYIYTECAPCGGYYRTDEDAWVVKETHASVHEFATLAKDDPYSNYSEAQYGNHSIDWIKRIVAEKQEPFFAFVGTSGPHLGVVPAPWHRRRTVELAKTLRAPRTPSFNVRAADHHPLLATAPELGAEAIATVDLHMRDRWGTLFSIDDMVAGIHAALVELDILDHTYMFFTSDHGYHLGQFRMPDEKVRPNTIRRPSASNEAHRLQYMMLCSRTMSCQVHRIVPHPPSPRHHSLPPRLHREDDAVRN